MKTLYIDCNMGAAGDMLMSALLELHPNPDEFISRMNALGIPHVQFDKSPSVKCGITGTHINITVDGQHENEHIHDHGHSHHHHTGMHEIEHIISEIDIPENVRTDIMAVYNLIAEAESHAHGCEINQIHFHEVGSMDAVADITGVCMLIHELKIDKIIASPIHVGCGHVKCAHGILSVPAPATAYILRNIPIYGGSIHSELCTPTGAALLAHFADEFGSMPIMRVSKIGYGMGTKDFETANCVRVMLGDIQSDENKILELKCNIDDMTAEEIGFATKQLMKAGALDVFTVPIGMKKNRPATLITCICRPADKETMVKAIFKHTSTIGIRQSVCERYVLDRTEDTVKTAYGDVCVKRASGYGIKRVKAEYNDAAEIADRLGCSIHEARQLIEKEAQNSEQ